MIAIAPASQPRRLFRRGSLLLTSCLVRSSVALVGVALIWLGTAWALGWL